MLDLTSSAQISRYSRRHFRLILTEESLNRKIANIMEAYKHSYNTYSVFNGQAIVI